MNKLYHLIPRSFRDPYNDYLWYDQAGFHLVLDVTNGEEHKIVKKLLKTHDLFIARERRDKILKQLKGKEFTL